MDIAHLTEVQTTHWACVFFFASESAFHIVLYVSLLSLFLRITQPEQQTLVLMCDIYMHGEKSTINVCSDILWTDLHQSETLVNGGREVLRHNSQDNSEQNCVGGDRNSLSVKQI